jgi:hypothetical protein
MLSAVWAVFDLDPDFITLLVAAAVSLLIGILRYASGRKPYITTGRCIRDFLNAGAIVPFVMLFIAVGSPKVFDHLKSSKLALGLAGFVGLVFVMGELYRAYSSTSVSDLDLEKEDDQRPRLP